MEYYLQSMPIVHGALMQHLPILTYSLKDLFYKIGTQQYSQPVLHLHCPFEVYTNGDKTDLQSIVLSP